MTNDSPFVRFYEKTYPIGTIHLNSLFCPGAKIFRREGTDEADEYFSKAVDCYLDAKYAYEKLYGKVHPDYAMVLNNLGSLAESFGDYEEAEDYYLEAKDIYEKLFGNKHPDYALALNNLSVLYKNMDNYDKAIPYQLEAKNIYEKTYGKENLDYIRSIDNLRIFYLATKNYTQAATFNNELCKLTIDTTNQNFSFMSEQQRNLYWEKDANIFEPSYSLSWYNPTPALNGLNYNNALFSKGLLLRTTNDVRDAVYSSGNAREMASWMAWVKSRLSRKQMIASGTVPWQLSSNL